MMKEFLIKTPFGEQQAYAKDYGKLIKARPDYGSCGSTVYERVEAEYIIDEAPTAPTHDTAAPQAWWVDVFFPNNSNKVYTYWTDHFPGDKCPKYAIVDSPYGGKTVVKVMKVRPMDDVTTAISGNWKRIIGFVDTTGYDRYIADTKRRKIEQEVAAQERKLEKLRSQLDKLD